MLISNISNNSERLFLHYVANWPMIYRNPKQLAEVLINLCIRDNPNVKYLHAQVKKENEPSFNLFFKSGFKIENEMQDVDNNIVSVMSKDI